jgi:hypothetical protein
VHGKHAQFAIDAWDYDGIHIIGVGFRLGSDDFEPEHKLEVKVFPNPASSSIQVHLLNERFGKIQLRIVNVLGELVYEQSLPQEVVEIPVQDLANGFYVVNVSSAYSQKNIKISIQH